MKSKTLGGILIILGTCIGAGMLALPIASAQEGFLAASLYLIISWMAMTFGAFLILEVSLWLPEGTNLVSMAKITLGRKGQIATWIFTLLLLYSLLCAYISGNADVLTGLLRLIHVHINMTITAIIVVFLFGFVVYRGISSVDWVNRILMFIKFAAFAVLILFLFWHIHPDRLIIMPHQMHISTLMVMITSFGYALIIPSLRTYFKSDIKKLRAIILIGSLIPLFIYLIWLAVIQGIVTHAYLISIKDSSNPIALLMASLNQHTNNIYLSKISTLFISICAMTSFLGVGLTLIDFIADGIKINKHSSKGFIVYLLTFAPPLIIVIFAPGIFIKALAYAGIFCLFILIILPILMTYHGRYVKKLDAEYRVFGEKFILLTGFLFALFLIIWAIWHLI